MNFHFFNIKGFFGGPLSPFYPEKSPFQSNGPFSAYLNIHEKWVFNRLSDLPSLVTSAASCSLAMVCGGREGGSGAGVGRH